MQTFLEVEQLTKPSSTCPWQDPCPRFHPPPLSGCSIDPKRARFSLQWSSLAGRSSSSNSFRERSNLSKVPTDVGKRFQGQLGLYVSFPAAQLNLCNRLLLYELLLSSTVVTVRAITPVGGLADLFGSGATHKTFLYLSLARSMPNVSPTPPH